MERTQWRQERRLWNEVQMDTIYARQYDQRWGSEINPTHRQMLERFLDSCPGEGYLLDAACGTGKYWPMLLGRGFSVLGTDQSEQMLRQAQARFAQVSMKHVGMQEIAFEDVFDGVMCMDAMENVFPEDWLVILRNFFDALHECGHLYFTVEVESEEELNIAYEAGKRLGLPLIYGEYAHHGGYHYYPDDQQVRTWLVEAQFVLLEVTEGDGYRHYLAQKNTWVM